MCLVRTLDTAFLIMASALWLSQSRSTSGASPVKYPHRRCSQISSLAAIPAETYSASVVEVATEPCSLLTRGCQDMYFEAK